MELNYPLLGIDVSKAKIDVCLLDEQGERSALLVKNASSGFTQLRAWLGRHKADHVTACIEATNVYSAAITLFLYEQGMTVCLANPTAVHAFMRAEMQRAKTDKADAVSIANFARAMAEKLRPWQPLPAHYAELRDLVRYLHDLTRCRAKAKNRMEKIPYLKSAAKARIQRAIKADLAHYEKEIRLLTKDIRACLRKNLAMQQRYDLVTSAPGIGFVTAVTFMAEIPDINQFSHAKQLAAYAGVTPRIRHSGDRRPVSQPISKMGNARLRQAFFMASLSARQHNNAMKVCPQHGHEKKPMVLQIAVARKLLHLLYAMETHHKPFDQNHQKQRMSPGTI